MWKNSSACSTDMSSGYISNTASMNTSPKYASVGKVNHSGTKRTPSIVLQPRVPEHYEKTLFSKPVKFSSNDSVMNRCESRTSRSSENSKPGRNNQRRTVRNRPQRISGRNSRLVRNSDVRSSLRALHRVSLRNTRHKFTNGAKIENGSTYRDMESGQIETIIKNNKEINDSRENVPPLKTKKVYLLSWNPRFSIKRVKSLHLKPSKGSKMPMAKPKPISPVKHYSYSHVNSAENLDKRKSKDLPSKSHLCGEDFANTNVFRSSKRDSNIQCDAKSNKATNQIGGGNKISSKLPSISDQHSIAKIAPPSECSSAPRPPIWQRGSQESITDMSELLTFKNSNNEPNNLKKNIHCHRSLQHLPQEDNHKKSILGMIKRNFTMRFRDSRDRAKYSKHKGMDKIETKLSQTNANSKATKSCEHLFADQTPYSSNQTLPLKPLRQHRLKTQLGDMRKKANSTAADKEPIYRKRQDKQNFSVDLGRSRGGNLIPTRYNRSLMRQSKDDNVLLKKSLERPIEPILQNRRSISQPSLFFPYETDPAEEPFTHYANLPFQLPVKVGPARNPYKETESETGHLHTSGDEFNKLVRKRFPNEEPKNDEYTGITHNREAPKLKSLPAENLISSNRRGDIRMHNQRIRGNSALNKTSRLEFSSFVPFDTTEAPSYKPSINGDLKLTSQPETTTDGAFTANFSSSKNNRTLHHKHGNDQVPQGYIAIPGRGTVSEKITNITNSHEENEDVREEQEIHHLGNYKHEDVQRAIRDGSDARAVVRRRQSAHTDSSDYDGGHMVALEPGERRVIHQAARIWRTVDKEDIHEKNHRDSRGELHTETTRTKHSEQFHNLQAPDEDSEAEDGSEEEVLTSSKNRRHVRDVDMLEYYSMLKGGRLADGIKIGEGLRHVQENIEEDQEGDNLDDMSERILEMRRRGIQSSRRTSTKPQLEYHEHDKARHSQTNKWLENHFGSESGQSQSSTERLPQKNESGRSSSCGRDVTDRLKKEDSYEFNQSSDYSNRIGNGQKHSHHKESYTRHVHKTPQQVYIKETRQGPDGGFESVEILPNGSSRHHYLKERNRHYSPHLEQFNSLKSDKSNSSLNRSNREVHFENSIGRMSRTRNNVGFETELPPSTSPPPPPPPRHKKKNKEKLSKFDEHRDNRVSCYASSPVVSSNELAEYRRNTISLNENPRSHRARQNLRNDENNEVFSSNDENANSMTRKIVSSSSKYYHKDTPTRVDRGMISSGESKFRPSYYLGEEPYGSIHNKSASMDQLQKTSPDYAQFSEIQNRKRGDREKGKLSHYQAASRGFGAHGKLHHDRNIVRNKFEAAHSQTMPHKVSDRQNVGRLSSGGDRFGGSMVNVSGNHNNLLHKATRPFSSSVQRSNSMYLQSKNDKFDVGLKSPDIISKIQRSASMKKIHDETDLNESKNYNSLQSDDGKKLTKIVDDGKFHSSRSPPQLHSKPNSHTTTKENYMKGLMRKAPELYGVLHGNERKDSTQLSPKHGPLSSHHNRRRSPTLPLGIDRNVFPKTPPVFKRIEHLRADEEISARNDSRYPHSTTETLDYSASRDREIPQLTRYLYKDDLYTAPVGRRTPSDTSTKRTDTHQTRPLHSKPAFADYKPRHENGAVVIEVRNWEGR